MSRGGRARDGGAGGRLPGAGADGDGLPPRSCGGRRIEQQYWVELRDSVRFAEELFDMTLPQRPGTGDIRERDGGRDGVARALRRPDQHGVRATARDDGVVRLADRPYERKRAREREVADLVSL